LDSNPKERRVKACCVIECCPW